MSWRRVDQGIDGLTLEVQPAVCPVCHKGLYRNVTFLTGGWARCSVCTEVVHYRCLAGGAIFKARPRICMDCKAGRVRAGQHMPVPPVNIAPECPVAEGVAPVSAPPSGS